MPRLVFEELAYVLNGPEAVGLRPLQSQSRRHQEVPAPAPAPPGKPPSVESLLERRGDAGHRMGLPGRQLGQPCIGQRQLALLQSTGDRREEALEVAQVGGRARSSSRVADSPEGGA